MSGQATGSRRRPSWPMHAASGFAVCILFIWVAPLCRSQLRPVSTRVTSRMMLHTAAAAGSSQQACKGRDRLSTAALQARRAYQAYLLEDAKRFLAPIVKWAGAICQPTAAFPECWVPQSTAHTSIIT